jgi:hypothetical protein
LPHAIIECGKHELPVQQPVAQVVPLHPEHTPSVQNSPVAHCEQARPALPHAIGSVPG